MKVNKHIVSLVAGAVFSLTNAAAFAATVDPAEFSQMSTEAKKNGAAPVIVKLAQVTLNQLKDDPTGLKAAMTTKSARLLAELGQQAWEGGRWENGGGQIGVYVTDAGLKILQNSVNAASFYPGQHWSARTPLAVRTVLTLK